jgi:hypothetical protein
VLPTALHAKEIRQPRLAGRGRSVRPRQAISLSAMKEMSIACSR